MASTGGIAITLIAGLILVSVAFAGCLDGASEDPEFQTDPDQSVRIGEAFEVGSDQALYWDMGDGTKYADARGIRHNYATPGTYAITASDGSEGEILRTYTVEARPWTTGDLWDGEGFRIDYAITATISPGGDDPLLRLLQIPLDGTASLSFEDGAGEDGFGRVQDGYLLAGRIDLANPVRPGESALTASFEVLHTASGPALVSFQIAPSEGLELLPIPAVSLEVFPPVQGLGDLGILTGYLDAPPDLPLTGAVANLTYPNVGDDWGIGFPDLPGSPTYMEGIPVPTTGELILGGEILDGWTLDVTFTIASFDRDELEPSALAMESPVQDLDTTGMIPLREWAAALIFGNLSANLSGEGFPDLGNLTDGLDDFLDFENRSGLGGLTGLLGGLLGANRSLPDLDLANLTNISSLLADLLPPAMGNFSAFLPDPARLHDLWSDHAFWWVLDTDGGFEVWSETTGALVIRYSGPTGFDDLTDLSFPPA